MNSKTVLYKRENSIQKEISTKKYTDNDRTEIKNEFMKLLFLPF